MQMLNLQLKEVIRTALAKAQAAGDLPAFGLPDEIPVERPKQESMGDYASPVCLQLARSARMAPLKIAQAVAAHVAPPEFCEAPEIAPPGFVNFRLSHLTGW